MGREINATASIVIRANQAEDSSDDPVYGAALANTWRWLRRVAGECNTVNFGILALSHQLPDDDTLADLSVAPPLTPVMLPAHVDGWAQTSPQPLPTADVSLFLHGVDRIAADIQVCWRADIELDDQANEDKALNTLSLAPPNAAECLPVPIGIFRRWLSGQDVADSSSDLEGEIAESDIENDERLAPRKAVCWRNRNETTVISDAQGLRPGDVCILPTSVHESLVLGDVPASNGGLDIGDRTALESRAKVTLRLHLELLKHWPQTELICALQTWLPEARALYEEDPVAVQAELLKRLGEIAEEGETGSRYVWLKRACHALIGDRRLRFAPHPAGGFIVRGSRHLPHSPSEGDFGDEDDATASGTVNVTLPVHLEGVGDFAARFAEACGLPFILVDALRCAGRLHDLGKADPRFQALLRGGNPWARGPLLAKSTDVPQSRQRYSEARAAAGYPQGGRHELLSVRLAESASNILPDDPLLCDLVLHLVASHHGYCRPFAPVIVDDSPRQVTIEFDGMRMMSSSDTQLERLDSGISERYWRLTHQFGWWGLAWLEAILRLADHRRSEWEESHIGERE
jgi:CRISPR-associated endonuclease/helicase Cas3